MITLKGRQSKVELSYGARGKSAYQVAVDNGFEGTEKEWLDSLKGKDGAQGPQGEPGKDGTMRFEELTEEQKESLKGETGPQGEPGPQGPQGENGNDYVLTESDKSDIANLVLTALPVAEEVRV